MQFLEFMLRIYVMGVFNFFTLKTPQSHEFELYFKGSKLDHRKNK